MPSSNSRNACSAGGPLRSEVLRPSVAISTIEKTTSAASNFLIRIPSRPTSRDERQPLAPDGARWQPHSRPNFNPGPDSKIGISGRRSYMMRRAWGQAAWSAAGGGEIEPRAVSVANELLRHEQNLLAQGVECGVLKGQRQTETHQRVAATCRSDSITMRFRAKERKPRRRRSCLRRLVQIPICRRAEDCRFRSSYPTFHPCQRAARRRAVRPALWDGRKFEPR